IILMLGLIGLWIWMEPRHLYNSGEKDFAYVIAVLMSLFNTTLIITIIILMLNPIARLIFGAMLAFFFVGILFVVLTDYN
ncbi:MAG TPA: hypothetical protein DCW31_01340, partial [Lactobacillus sp.]|nr:hypothetical protein [Lactobacillus sp.]